MNFVDKDGTTKLYIPVHPCSPGPPILYLRIYIEKCIFCQISGNKINNRIGDEDYLSNQL